MRSILKSRRRLVDAAYALVAKDRAQSAADEVIDAALRGIDDDIDADTDAEVVAAGLERLAAIEDARGLAAAAQAGVGAPWPPVDGARELFGLAGERLTASSTLLTAALGAEDEGKLAAEHSRLTALWQALGTRLHVT